MGEHFMMKINATLQKSSHVDADLLVVYLACYFLFYCSNMPYIQATTTPTCAPIRSRLVEWTLADPCT